MSGFNENQMNWLLNLGLRETILIQYSVAMVSETHNLDRWIYGWHK